MTTAISRLISLPLSRLTPASSAAHRCALSAAGLVLRRDTLHPVWPVRVQRAACSRAVAYVLVHVAHALKAEKLDG